MSNFHCDGFHFKWYRSNLQTSYSEGSSTEGFLHKPMKKRLKLLGNEDIVVVTYFDK